MLGAAGALCCVAAGTAVGSWLRERRAMRYRLIRAETEALSRMRVLLEQERPALPELLRRSADNVSCADGVKEVAMRLRLAAETLEREPLSGVEGAYACACRMVGAPQEGAEEKEAMTMLFRQLGIGTAGMREQAVAACLRRLKPLEEQTRGQMEKGGKLCMQLGMLLGLMAGIVLW